MTRSADAPPPPRVLGLFDASCIVIGAIIGVGIFFTPARMAALVGSGPLLLLAWLLAGFIVLAGALTFAELGARYHRSAAQYEILRDTYGPLPAFLFVFCNATAVQGGAIGIIAIICVQNFVVALGQTSLGPGWSTLASVGLVVGLTAANVLGVRWGARIQNATVLMKLLTLVAIGALGAFAPVQDTPVGRDEVQSKGVLGVLAALVPAFFAFGGFQHALWISGEVREPKRNLPRAILVGVVVVVVVYLLANWSYLRLLGGASAVAASKTLAADAVARAAPSVGGRVIAAAVGISALGVLNAQLLSGPRLVFGMARDGRFFPAFGRLDARFGTPSAAIWFVGAIAVALLVLAGEKGVDRLLTGVVFVDGVFFAATGAALFVLRRRGGEASFRTPGYPLPPLFFVLGAIGVVVGAHLDPAVLPATLIGAAWIAAGALLYFVRFRGK
ncbi:APC family permease [Polyangium jinanense]|uniref:APC family permease n=1 Tax=Polyangium jinanense TaxID=2829994 RepID=A0A9X4AU41_9BACT|nr:APC family permease [Polyangium jinanense]MDC3961086.1 APC family permease [Polyangium jinanense]MDC3982837.1 APC family permease [Polyangium jinanense]